MTIPPIGLQSLAYEGVNDEPIIPPALEVLEAVGARYGFGFSWTEHDWSCDRFLRTGAMMPDDGVAQIRTKTPSSSAPSVRRMCPTMFRFGAC